VGERHAERSVVPRNPLAVSSLEEVTVAAPAFPFDNTFARELEGLHVPWRPQAPPEPRLLALNAPLAAELGLDPEELRGPAGVAVLAGAEVPEGASPVAQAYAGHQFGGFSPRLGDGRALLLGEVVDRDGRRRDLHLKGSGATPFSRGGDGKAAVGPMLREYVVGEAMHALGIPTTRALAVVATGEQVVRETFLPGAVLTRVAASHIRVGTFEYAATQGGPELVRQLADYAIARHHPSATAAEAPYLAFYEAVVEAQAALVAQWMLVGFIHGVMNTDNMTISGETIDYGPCAFMEAFDPATVFSSIDHGGRYAYGNQALIAQWNLARLAETLLPLLGDDAEAARAAAVSVLQTFAERFNGHFNGGMRAKLGLDGEQDGDAQLVDDLLRMLHAQQVDYTSCLRALSGVVRGDGDTARALFSDPAGFDEWCGRWYARLPAGDPHRVADAMDRVNPLYIPRNHLVEEALAAATAGDLAPFEQLVDAVTAPFEERPGLERYAAPAPAGFCGTYRTFCGT
jgi:serine/tyrosine/threonine adenylyltransferase